MYTLGIDAFASRNERSGVEWYAYHLLRAMKKNTPKDWRVFLYSLNKDDFTKDIVNENWQWKRLGWWPKKGWGHFRLSWEMIWHPVNTLFVPTAMIPLVHPHRSSQEKWTITTIHDAEFLKHPEIYAPADRRRQEVALAFALRHAARIFMPSEATRTAIGGELQDEQARVIPLGVDHARYYSTVDQTMVEKVLAKYELKNPYLLFVGRIDKKKNLPALIRSYAVFKKNNSAKKCGLVLAGSKGFGAEEVQTEIKNQEIQDSVRILGYVPEEDLPYLYNGAKLFVFPSENEGFGLPLLQALACGTPTIAAQSPVLREVAGEAALFVDPSDTKSFAETINRLLSDEMLQAELCAKGLARAKNFSWDFCAEEVWREILNLVQ